MAKLIRLDAELVRRGIAKSRTAAAQLVKAGRVKVDGQVALKPARQVDPAQALVVTSVDEIEYVSRGGHKIAGALAYLEICGSFGAPLVTGRRCLDAGASTGGFTDVLLRAGAETVLAVDVGYGQLAWQIRTDERVICIERTNIRTLDPQVVAPPPQLVVGDISFISLTLVLPALRKACAADADFLLLVKPQFEVGRDDLGAGGVVRDKELHYQAVLKVCESAVKEDLQVRGLAASPLPGPSGNIEYFVWFADSTQPHIATADLSAAIWEMINDGPEKSAAAVRELAKAQLAAEYKQTELIKNSLKAPMEESD